MILITNESKFGGVGKLIKKTHIVMFHEGSNIYLVKRNFKKEILELEKMGFGSPPIVSNWRISFYEILAIQNIQGSKYIYDHKLKN
jgi:hypothetical protein